MTEKLRCISIVGTCGMVVAIEIAMLTKHVRFEEVRIVTLNLLNQLSKKNGCTLTFRAVASTNVLCEAKTATTSCWRAPFGNLA